MKNAPRFLLLSLFFALSFGLNAQVNGNIEDELIDALRVVPNLDGNISQVVLDQATSNVVDIELYNRQLADVKQSGSYNEVYLTMDGDLNGAAVRQKGRHNVTDIVLDGEETTIGVIQDGNNNYLQLDYRNTDDINARFIQNGYNISVTHKAEDIQGLDYTIEFTGSDMNIQVEDLNQYIQR